MVHQEAAHAGELVFLARHDLDGQLFVGQVGTRELEGLRGLCLVLVDLAGVLVVPAGLELLDALADVGERPVRGFFGGLSRAF